MISPNLLKGLSIILVVIFIGPVLQSLSVSISDSFNKSCTHTKLLSVDLENDENKSEQDNEKEENDANNEFTLADHLGISHISTNTINFFVIDFKSLKSIDHRIITPPPKSIG